MGGNHVMGLSRVSTARGSGMLPLRAGVRSVVTLMSVRIS